MFKVNCDSLSGLLVMAFPRDTYMRLFAAPFKAKIVCRSTEVPSEIGQAKIVCRNTEVPSEIGQAKIVCRNIDVSSELGKAKIVCCNIEVPSEIGQAKIVCPSEIRTSVVIKLGLHVVYIVHANSVLV